MYKIIDYYTGQAWQGITKTFPTYREALRYAIQYGKDLTVSNMYLITK